MFRAFCIFTFYKLTVTIRRLRSRCKIFPSKKRISLPSDSCSFAGVAQIGALVLRDSARLFRQRAVRMAQLRNAHAMPPLGFIISLLRYPSFLDIIAYKYFPIQKEIRPFVTKVYHCLILTRCVLRGLYKRTTELRNAIPLSSASRWA